jgi:hypothetical protein
MGKAKWVANVSLPEIVSPRLSLNSSCTIFNMIYELTSVLFLSFLRGMGMKE